MNWPPPLPNLPALFADETLYSWSGFVHAWNANTDVRETSRQLFGAPYAALLHDFPSHLNALDDRLQHQLGHTRDLALGHTLLGYFLPIQPPQMAANILDSVHRGAMSHLKIQLGIAASQVGGHHPLKGCVRCFDEDEKEHGRAYWRVEHQFPSTLVCTEHQCSLQIAWDPTTPVHRRGWILPRMGLQRAWVEIPPLTPIKFDRLARLANFSTHWAALDPGSLEPSALAMTYQSALCTLGFATASGSLRLATLVAEVRSHYAGLEDLPGFQALKSVRTDWPGLVGSLARGSPRNGHPLKHMLLISMLFVSWQDFLKSYASQVDVGVTETFQVADPRPLIDPKQVQFKTLVLEQGLSITAAAARSGVTTSTGVRWAKVFGIPFTPRTKNLTAVKLAQIRALLSSGLRKQDVLAQCDISSVSLNRLLSSEPSVAQTWRAARQHDALLANRQLFLNAVCTHPGWPLQQIRKIPGNGYMWLYRHDRPWLLEHLPAIWRRED